MKNKIIKIIFMAFFIVLILSLKCNADTIEKKFDEINNSTITLRMDQTLEIKQTGLEVISHTISASSGLYYSYNIADTKIISGSSSITGGKYTIEPKKVGTTKVTYTQNDGVNSFTVIEFTVEVIETVKKQEENESTDSIETTIKNNFGKNVIIYEEYLNGRDKDQAAKDIIEGTDEQYESAKTQLQDNLSSYSLGSLAIQQYNKSGISVEKIYKIISGENTISFVPKSNGEYYMIEIKNVKLKAIKDFGTNVKTNEQFECTGLMYYLTYSDKIIYGITRKKITDSSGNVTSDLINENTYNIINDNMDDAKNEIEKNLKEILAKFSNDRGSTYAVNTPITDVLTPGNESIYINENDDSDVPDELISKVNSIISVITTTIMVICVLILAILGIKYMMGSIEQKADYKKDLIPYVVGCVLVFGINAILKIVEAIAGSLF